MSAAASIANLAWGLGPAPPVHSAGGSCGPPFLAEERAPPPGSVHRPRPAPSKFLPHSMRPPSSRPPHVHLRRAALLRLEEEWVERVCAQIVAFKPDVVITEKGLSDLAAHHLVKAGVTAIRRLRKTDNNRIARAAGATIVHRPGQRRGVCGVGGGGGGRSLCCWPVGCVDGCAGGSPGWRVVPVPWGCI